jgi:hypothetical protein
MKRRHDPGRCPQCRERVTPFAAGCAICGADLDISRFDSGPTLTQRAGSWASALTSGPALVSPRRSRGTLADYALSWLLLVLILSAVSAAGYAVVSLLGGA